MCYFSLSFLCGAVIVFNVRNFLFVSKKASGVSGILLYVIMARLAR